MSEITTKNQENPAPAAKAQEGYDRKAAQKGLEPYRAQIELAITRENARRANEPQDASWFDSDVLAPIEEALEAAAALASRGVAEANEAQISALIDAAMEAWKKWRHPRDEDEWSEWARLPRLDIQSDKKDRVCKALDRLEALSAQVPGIAGVLGNRHENGFLTRKDSDRALTLWLRAIDADSAEALNSLFLHDWSDHVSRVTIVLRRAIARGSAIAPNAAALLMSALRWPSDEFDPIEMRTLLDLARTAEPMGAHLAITVAFEEQSGIFDSSVTNFSKYNYGAQLVAIAVLIGFFPGPETEDARAKARSKIARYAALARENQANMHIFGTSLLAQMILFGCPVGSLTAECANSLIDWLSPLFDDEDYRWAGHIIPALQGAIRHAAKHNTSKDPIPLIRFLPNEAQWRAVTDDIESLANLPNSLLFGEGKRMLLCAWLWSSMQHRHRPSAAAKLVDLFGPCGSAGRSIRPRWVGRCLAELRGTLETEPVDPDGGDSQKEKLARVSKLIGDVRLADRDAVDALASAIEEYTRALSSARSRNTKLNIASRLKRIAVALGSSPPVDSPRLTVPDEAPGLVRRECFDMVNGKGRLLNAIAAEARESDPALVDRWFDSVSIAAEDGLRDIVLGEPKYQTAAQFVATVELAELLRLRSRPEEAARLLVDSAESAIEALRQNFCEPMEEQPENKLKWLLRPSSKLFELIFKASDALRLGDGITRDANRAATLLGCFDATMRTLFKTEEIDNASPDYAVRTALFVGLNLLAQQSIVDSKAPSRAAMKENLGRLAASLPPLDPNFAAACELLDIEQGEEPPEDDEREALDDAAMQRARSNIAPLNGGVDEINISEWRTRILSILIEHWDIRPSLESEDKEWLRSRCRGPNIEPLSEIVNHLTQGRDPSALIAKLLPQSYERESTGVYIRCVVAAGIASDDFAALDRITLSKVTASLDEVILQPSKRDLGRRGVGDRLPDRLLERKGFDFKSRIQRAQDQQVLDLQRGHLEEVEKTRREWVSYLTHTVNNTISSVTASAEACMDIVANPGEDAALDQREAVRSLGAVLSGCQSIQNLAQSYNDLSAGSERLTQLWTEDSTGTICLSDVVADAVLQVIVHLLFAREEFEMLELSVGCVVAARKATLLCARDSSRPAVVRMVAERFGFLALDLAADGILRMRRGGTRYTLIKALASELILNAIKYHDSRTSVQVSVEVSTCAEVVRIANLARETPRRSGSQRGLVFVRRACDDLHPLVSYQRTSIDRLHAAELHFAAGGCKATACGDVN